MAYCCCGGSLECHQKTPSKHAELVQIIHEMDMRKAMFNLNMWGPDDEQFTTGMWDFMLGTSLSTTFGSLVAIMATYVGKHIHEVTIAMAVLEDVEGRCCEAGGRNTCVVMPRPQRAEKKKKGPMQGPVQVNRTQVWTDC